MTNETEQLRRMVEARERATKGPVVIEGVPYCDGSDDPTVLTVDGTYICQTVYDHQSLTTDHAVDEDTLFIAGCFNTDLRSILTRMEKMEAALRFYADHKRNTKEGIYGRDNMVHGYFEHDQGQRAKEAFE